MNLATLANGVPPGRISITRIIIPCNVSLSYYNINFLNYIDIFFHFKLVDDVLDFNSSQEVLGKPVAADLRLGLATGPVLFASEEVHWPEISFCNV
jgi:hypothetical protein